VAGRIDLEAESARVEAPMRRSADPGASGGAFVSAPEGTARGGQGKVEFAVRVTQPGDYGVWARVRAPSGRSNSFYVAVDGGDRIVFDTPGPGEQGVLPDWTWVPLVRRGHSGPWRYSLAPGVHRFQFVNRQDGTELDRIVVTTEDTFASPP